MGYPMTYKRLIVRNHLHGGYDGVGDIFTDSIGAPQWGDMVEPRIVRDPYQLSKEANRLQLAGDLRRLEADQRDIRHLKQYADRTSLTEEQVKAVLDAFFEGDF